MDLEKEKHNLYNAKRPFQFRRFPTFLEAFHFTKVKKANVGEDHINQRIHVSKTFKKIGFKFGNVVSSFWFIVMLFYFQSYFLKQNLQKSDSKFISD